MKPKSPVRLLLDSGAFSAWNRGETIDLADYVSYIKAHESLLEGYVTLDVIPGVFGRRRTQKEVDDSAAASYANHQMMKAEGLSPIPVFHQGERLSWLERYLEDGERYIGVSTYKDLVASEQQLWLDKVFSVLTDSDGLPLVKVHGFGITAVDHLIRYPWRSVDSTTWSLTPGYGLILVPQYRNGRPDYRRSPSRVIMSGIKHETSNSHRRQFQNLDQYDRACVEDFLGRVGVAIYEARYDDDARRKVTLAYFQQFAEHRSVERFRFRKDRPGDDPKRRGSPADGFAIYYATVSNNPRFNAILTGAGAWDRLLSYFELKSRPEGYLAYYLEHGAGPPIKVKKKKLNIRSSSYIKRCHLGIGKRAAMYEASDPNDI